MKEVDVWKLINHEYPCKIEAPDMDDSTPDINYEEWIDLIDAQLTRINPDDKFITIEGRDIGWKKRDGVLHFGHTIDATMLVNKLNYAHGTLTFFYDPQLSTLKATLTHHDNPVNGDQFIIFLTEA